MVSKINLTYVKASYDLHIYGVKLPHPRSIEDPTGGVSIAWIPQSMTNSIWVVYEFKNNDLALEFINSTGIYEQAKKDIANKVFRKLWRVEKW